MISFSHRGHFPLWHWVPELGGEVMGYCESMFLNLFNSSFPISVLYPGAVISHQESLSILKVFFMHR